MMLFVAPQTGSASRYRAKGSEGGAVPARGVSRYAALLSIAAFAGIMGWGFPVMGHPADLDEYGGHFDEKTGGYHYHRPKWDMAKRTEEYLNWIVDGEVGELVGVVARVERPDAVWVHIPYRPAYQSLAYYVSRQNRDDEHAQIKVWFQYVSPEISAQTQDKAYAKWFKKKVIYELDRKLRGKPVTVQFHLVPRAGRMIGMVMQDQENINIWLVLNGWSFHMLDKGGNPHEASFSEAEAIARREKAGLWGRGR